MGMKQFDAVDQVVQQKKTVDLNSMRIDVAKACGHLSKKQFQVMRCFTANYLQCVGSTTEANPCQKVETISKLAVASGELAEQLLVTLIKKYTEQSLKQVTHLFRYLVLSKGETERDLAYERVIQAAQKHQPSMVPTLIAIFPEKSKELGFLEIRSLCLKVKQLSKGKFQADQLYSEEFVSKVSTWAETASNLKSG